MGDQSQGTYRCRPRFKGLEGFFRRIAFNLGNSPSQTEVKVISCIPIDVTDLQHRIVTLEHELERYQHEQQPGDTVMRSAQAGTPRRGEPPGPLPEPLTSTTSTPNKSNPSLFYSSEHPERSSPRPSESREVPDNCRCACPPKKRPSPNRTSEDRTELVYFAHQANRTPFSACNTPYSAYDQLQSTSKDSPIENLLSSSYLKDIIRKQCRSQKLPSNESQFSSPVCRDNGPPPPPPRPRPAPVCVSDDVCSCCRGNFHDIDASKRALDTYDIPSAPNDHLSMYYDSSMYDLVPVKERQDDIKPKKKENVQAQLKYAHEKIYRSRMQPYTVTYNNGAVKNGRRLAGKRKHHVNRSVPKRRHEPLTIDRGFPSKISEELYQDMELQTYCMKPLRKARPRPPSPPRTPPVKQKNAECLTVSVNTECQTASTKSVQLDPPAPAPVNNEDTLDQIKTILQTVLTEVKTNVREKIHETQKTPRGSQEGVKADPKKDAEVQKGASQKNMAACSSLMNSFYYSPYNMNPYTTSCSPFHLNSCYPPAMKCFQNYPLFIQTTGRQCDLCNKNPQGSSKVMPKRPATNNATNTESMGKTQHSKETEKLIQEIYKSIAVNFDMTSKEATSDCDEDIKSERSEGEYGKKLAKQSNLSKRKEDVPVKTAQTKEQSKKLPAMLYMNPTFNTPRNSDEVSVHLTHVRPTKREGIQRTVELLTQPHESSDESDHYRPWHKKEPVRAQANSDKTASIDVDATPSDVTVISVKKKEKPSLFAKMCKVFKGKNKKGDVQPSEVGSVEDDVEEISSDSDDYQTIYSEQDDTRGRRMVTAAHVQMPAIREQRYKRTSHSKVAYPRYVPAPKPPERYAHQEFRRPRWNEGISLVTPGRAAKQAYEQAQARKYDTKYSERVSPYWRNYETRRANVERDAEPKKPVASQEDYERQPQRRRNAAHRVEDQEDCERQPPRRRNAAHREEDQEDCERQTPRRRNAAHSVEDQEDYERQPPRRRIKDYEQQDEPKVFKSVAKKFQWFRKPNMECRHTLKKLLVDT